MNNVYLTFMYFFTLIYIVDLTIFFSHSNHKNKFFRRDLQTKQYGQFRAAIFFLFFFSLQLTADMEDSVYLF